MLVKDFGIGILILKFSVLSKFFSKFEKGIIEVIVVKNKESLIKESEGGLEF